MRRLLGSAATPWFGNLRKKLRLPQLHAKRLLHKHLRDLPDVPPAISSLVVGGADIGQQLAASADLPLISATGSVPMGRAVAQTVAARLGRSLLELGGNNGMIVAPQPTWSWQFVRSPSLLWGHVVSAVPLCDD